MGTISVSDLTGHSQVPEEKNEPERKDIFLNYAYALLTIAGADGEISRAEMNNLIHKVRVLGASDDLIEKIKKFDWRSSDLEHLISKLNASDIQGNCARALLYDAIKVARADGKFHDDEKRAICKTARLLGIDPNMSRAINGVIELEATSNTILQGLLENS